MVNKCQVSFGFLPAKSKKLIRTVIAFCRSLLCLKTAYENSLSEANYNQVREYWSNTYMFQYFWLVTMLQKNEKNCPFVGPPFCGGPVRPNMLNMPKSAAEAEAEAGGMCSAQVNVANSLGFFAGLW